MEHTIQGDKAQNLENTTLAKHPFRSELKAIGFQEIPHFTIGNSLIYELPRNRMISISSLRTLRW